MKISKKLVCNFLSKVKKREHQDKQMYYFGLLKKVFNRGGSEAVEIALYCGNENEEDKKKWLEVAAYDLDNADAYYMLGEYYFWEEYNETEYICFNSKAIQLIDTAIQKGCYYWNPLITIFLEKINVDKAISYYEYGYFHGNPKWKNEAAWRLCEIYDLKNKNPQASSNIYGLTNTMSSRSAGLGRIMGFASYSYPSVIELPTTPSTNTFKKPINSRKRYEFWLSKMKKNPLPTINRPDENGTFKEWVEYNKKMHEQGKTVIASFVKDLFNNIQM